MEEGDNVDVNGSGGAPAGSRWNPTKEQINMLESFYRQGIRTPSAEQIQQITSRLRAYGHIEGKNVFYWFQNHKARQRQKQKQKQENMAYINRYLHRNQPIFTPPCSNVICSPYYVPQSDIGFYPQYHHPNKVLLPAGGIKRRPRAEKLEKPRACSSGAGYDPSHQGYDLIAGNSTGAGMISNCNQETLSLFPLHPTRILQGKPGKSSIGSTSAAEKYSTTPSSSEVEEGPGDQPFFDFFSGQGSYGSD